MQTITMYRFKREDGGITVSPKKPEVEYMEMVRLVADEGKLLSKGGVVAGCVDTERADGWEEIADKNFERMDDLHEKLETMV